jgi:hypothetical protein
LLGKTLRLPIDHNFRPGDITAYQQATFLGRRR